jgi:hypothetical protein
MARVERMRELLSGTLDMEHVKEKTASGWRLVALEWRRQISGEGPDPETGEDVPYGLRVSADCLGLEEDPMEKQALMLMMEFLVQDRPFSSVAYELNQRDFRTRQGKLWTPVSVFNMLPRLIEVGPQMFSSAEWETRRQNFPKPV